MKYLAVVVSLFKQPQANPAVWKPGTRLSHELVSYLKFSSFFLPAGSKSPGLGAGFQVPMQGGGDGDGSRRGASAAGGGSLNEQIVVALARLQDDMQSVLERLHTLEALTASQVRTGGGGRQQAHGQTRDFLKNDLQKFFFAFLFEK